MNTLPIFDRNILVNDTDGDCIQLQYPIESSLYSDICELVVGEGKYSMEAVWLATQYYIIQFSPERVRQTPNMCVYLYLIESTIGGFMEPYMSSKIPDQFCIIDRSTIPCSEQTLADIISYYLNYSNTASWQRSAERYLPTVNPWALDQHTIEHEGPTHEWERTAPSALLAEDIAISRLKVLGSSIFDNTFDWTGVCIAGGSCSKAVDSQASVREQQLCDVDLFIYGQDLRIRKAALIKTLRWFQQFQPYYLINGSVCSIYIMNEKRKYQIVFSNDYSILQVLQRFDFTHVGWAYNGESIVCTPDAMTSLRTRVTKINSVKRFEFKRCVKALRNKYSIAETDTALLFEDIIRQAVDKTSPIVKQAIRQSLMVYYPHEDGIWNSLDENDREEYIMQKIMDDSGTNNIYRVADEAFGAINVYGNFSDDYGVSSFRNFSVNNINCKPVSRLIMQVVIRGNKGGPISIITDAVPCVLVNNTVVATATPELVVMFQTMDNKVYRIYSRRPLAVRSIVDNKVQFSAREGRELLFKSNKGDKLPTPEGEFMAKIKFNVVVDIENCKMIYNASVIVI